MAPSIPSPAVNDIDQVAALPLALEIQHQDVVGAAHVLAAEAADVRGDGAVLGVPERALLGEGFRVGDVEGGALEGAVVEGGDQVVLHEDLAAAQVHQETTGRVGVFEDAEFGRGEEVRG